MEETIHGTTMPVLELSLQAGESVVSEAGEFSWMSDSIQMETNTGGGMGGKGIMGAVKRAVSGASLMMTTYWAQGGAGSVAFASKRDKMGLPGSGNRAESETSRHLDSSGHAQND